MDGIGREVTRHIIADIQEPLRAQTFDTPPTNITVAQAESDGAGEPGEAAVRSGGRPSMTTILIVLWFITFRLDLGTKCIVAAWLTASACPLLWTGQWGKGARDKRSLTSADCRAVIDT